MQDSGNAFRLWFVASLIAIATAYCYWNVTSFEFVNYDDDGYILLNYDAQQPVSLQSIKWAFTAFEMANWHPLTWISYHLDFTIYGLNPGGYHATNVLIHILNSILLFLVLFRISRQMIPAAIIGLLFAIHPLHVESVAWVAERKDVLSALFLILCFAAYNEYSQTNNKVWLLATGFAFGFGLLAKPMLVTLPVMLLLFDHWPFRRLQLDPEEKHRWLAFPLAYFRRINLHLWVEKAPFFIMSAASSIITFLAQKQFGAVTSVTKLPVTVRVLNAFQSYALYLYKTVVPVDLALFYPYPKQISIIYSGIAFVILLLITLAALRAVRRYPFFTVGWFFFLGALLPVIGVLQVGAQSMADRYTYIPHIGLFIAAVFLVAEVLRYKWLKIAGGIVMAGILIVAIVLTQRQVQIWKNSETVFRHAISVTNGNRVAQQNLSAYYLLRGKYNKALYHARHAVQIDQYSAASIHNLGVAYERLNLLDSARKCYERALAIDSSHYKTYGRLAQILMKANEEEKALSLFIAATKLQPELASNWNNLGSYYFKTGQVDRALSLYSKAIEIDPRYDQPYLNLALFFLQVGETDKADQFINRCLEYSPRNPLANKYKGDIFMQHNKSDSAIIFYARSLLQQPKDSTVRVKLRVALSQTQLPIAGSAGYR